MKKIIAVIFIIAVLVFAGLFVIGLIAQKQEAKKQAQVAEPAVVQKVLLPEFEHDKDRDGILDEEEERLGTSDFETDTDGDGLSDKSEIEKWGTDPSKEDTDGDGYWDGIEILSGYNPNGPGRLGD